MIQSNTASSPVTLLALDWASGYSQTALVQSKWGPRVGKTGLLNGGGGSELDVSGVTNSACNLVCFGIPVDQIHTLSSPSVSQIHAFNLSFFGIPSPKTYIKKKNDFHLLEVMIFWGVMLEISMEALLLK